MQRFYLYMFKKKIEEEGVGGVPTPQVRDSTNKFIYNAVFSGCWFN